MSDSDSTARFCKKCNTETERHTSGRCKPCLRLLNANWRSKNPEKVKAQSAARYALNPEKARARNAAWAAENPCKVKENNATHYVKNKAKVMVQQAAWRAANPEKGREYAAASRIRDPEKHKQKSRIWSAANPDKAKAKQDAYRARHPEKIKAATAAYQALHHEAHRIREHNRRARKLASGGVLSAGLAEWLFELQKGMCPCCGEPLGVDYHLDHQMPLALGGANTDDNMQLLRKRCNMQKHAKHPIDFMQSRGFLL